MSARVLDPAAVAASFRAQVRADVASIEEPLTLRGLYALGHGPAATYAEYTRKACDEVGMRFDLRAVTEEGAERAVRDASEDPGVHGVLVYYPVGSSEGDAWLRELVDPRKDLEGLHSFWARCLYENRRYTDAARTKKAVLPCTPLAILKLLDAAGASKHGAEKPLAGVRACVFNRSEVVGRPLAAMMANDGAEVVSFDLDGAHRYAPGSARGAHHVEETSVRRSEALAGADVVVTGVPGKGFDLVRPDEIREGAVCVNFSTQKNFREDIVERAGVFVPRVGPMTVTMALRNTVRLYRNERARG